MNEPYKVTGPHAISVCAWCYPNRAIVDLFPDLGDCQISHGICPAHALKFYSDTFNTVTAAIMQPQPTIP